MAAYDFDLFVIGGGSGGVRAARIAAMHGAKVGIAEEYRLGGTCVIRGCVPKKLFVYASRFPGEFSDAAGYGWTIGEPKFDWKTLLQNKDKEIARLEAAYRRNLEAAGVEVFASRAVVAGCNRVQLADGREFSTGKILVATGAWPNVDGKLEGVEHVVTSNEAFHFDELPSSVVVAGGGYIAVEFAGIFAGLGVDTTLIYRGEKILRGFDQDLRDAVTEAYLERGIKIVTNDVFAKIERSATGLKGHLRSGGLLEAEAIMFAIGRSPNTRNLGLEAAGVELGSNGEIRVNERSQSSVPSIFAVGDVTDRVALTPVAIREGHAFADSEFGSNPRTTDYDMIPTAVFSTPELGTVGLPEHEALSKYPKLDVYKASFRPMKATVGGSPERATMKLLVDRESGRVVGCHLVAPDAAEIAQVVAIAMRLGATKADFDSTMALHPSLAEELVTMRTPTVRHGEV